MQKNIANFVYSSYLVTMTNTIKAK